MIPEPYASWPVVMSRAKAARLLGVDRKTLAKNKDLLAREEVECGGCCRCEKDFDMRWEGTD